MTISLVDFIKKYGLDDFTKILELKNVEKINFYNDFNQIMKIICRVFDKLTNIASLRGGSGFNEFSKVRKT